MTGSDNALRGLIRLLPVARSLRDEAEKAVQMELPLSGDLAANSLEGLIATVAKLTEDPYVHTLAGSFSAAPYASDKEKLTAVLFVASQLASYIEGEVGMPEGDHGHRQYAPYTQIMNVQGLTGEDLLRLAGAKEPEGED